jgi:D-lactate dehydrogenase
MKIVFFETTDRERDIFPGLVVGQDLIFVEEKLTPENSAQAKDAEIVSVFVNSELNKELIDFLPNLKLIVTRSTGYDHIDVKYAASKNIKVSNVPAYGSHTVAEFAFALILTLTRKVFNARHQMLEGDNFDISQLRGFEIYGKTLGVVGTGRIGKNVIKIAKGFGMNVLAYDVMRDEAFATEQEFKYVELMELLAGSDIVTMHAPYNEKTHHLINKDNVGTMKKGAYLINTARGELVETDALVKALADGNLAGAGLDVLEDERQLKEGPQLLRKDPAMTKDYKTLFQDQVLMDMPNVIITPHIAFFSQEGEKEIIDVAANNISSFISGAPSNILN